MKIMTIVATVIAVFPFALALLVPNWRLGDYQNAVDNVDLTGERVANNSSVATHSYTDPERH